MPQEHEPEQLALQDSAPAPEPPPKRNCFVVMPFGRTDDEVAWFAGWYKECIQKAVLQAGFVPVLAAAEDKPSAINDDIRRHLAFDPMVVVDLGGVAPAEPPNPNVMYELGIRHAFGLPLVLLAWKGQHLPFDIQNQRVVMEGRRLLDIEANITRIVDFIKAADQGDYYRPMDAVGRHAELEFATKGLGRDRLLRRVIQEVTGMKTRSINALFPKEARQKKTKSKGNPAHDRQVFHLIGSEEARSNLRGMLIAEGATTDQFNRITQSHLPIDVAPAAKSWGMDQWLTYFRQRLGVIKLSDLPPTVSPDPTPATIAPPEAPSDGHSPGEASVPPPAEA